MYHNVEYIILTQYLKYFNYFLF